jgi:hypothetical protein
LLVKKSDAARVMGLLFDGTNNIETNLVSIYRQAISLIARDSY